MPENMITSIIELLRIGLQSQFGEEVRFHMFLFLKNHLTETLKVAVVSVETINHLATFCSEDPHTNSFIVSHLSSLIEVENSN